MRQHLLDLNEIQTIDLGIREIEKRLESLPSRQKELEATCTTLRGELQKLTDQRDVLVKESKGLEGTVSAEALKIKKWEVRLNEIRNQREYLALSREVEGAKKQNRDAEERIQEIATQRGALDTQIEALQDKVAEAEIDLGSERDRVNGLASTEITSLDAEKSRRQALVGKVPGALLRKYDAIRQKRFGVGLVSVIDGSCQGCNMKLPPQLYNILQRVESVEQCPSCQRIVFWSRILPEGAAAAVKGAEASP